MLILILGAVRSGKSALGEDYAQALSQGRRKVYLATAAVTDSEMERRVEKHRQSRADKQFYTLEQPRDIGCLQGCIQKEDTILLDCLGNLLANEMFGDAEPKSARLVVQKLLADSTLLAEACENLIIISNDIFSEGSTAEPLTEEYRLALGLLHQALAQKADTVIECTGGIPIYQKGTPLQTESKGSEAPIGALILGGAYQGKHQRALTLCTKNRPNVFSFGNQPIETYETAFTADILLGVHTAVRTILQNEKDPVAFFQQNLPRLSGKILTGDEIGGGIVPMDAQERLWRDETGRVYTLLAEHAAQVERVYAGIPQLIKKQSSFKKTSERGLVHLYYGDGKGKTTAALGLGLRACGAGLQVCMAQFLKGLNSSEINTLPHLGNCFHLLPGIPVQKFTRAMSPEELEQTKKEQQDLFCRAVQQGLSGAVDLLILDELVDAVNLRAVSLEQVQKFLANPYRRCEVVITGHRPVPEWFPLCDYVTEMKKGSHPFDKGITARIGIEK